MRIVGRGQAARPSAAALLLLLALAACGEPPARENPAQAAPLPADARERAVQLGLAWLTQAQEAKGHWDLARWNPWHGNTGLHGFTEEDHWFGPAATGLALLAFLEHHASGAPFPAAVERGLDALLRWQTPTGRIGWDEEAVDAWFREHFQAPGFASDHGPGYKAFTLHSFNHAVPTAALALASRLGGKPAWRSGAQRALQHMLDDEHPEYSWTAYLDPDSDIGMVAYVAQAARDGAAAGLEAESRPILKALPDFLARVTDVETGRTRMLSDHPYCFEGDDSTAINGYARHLIGEAPDSKPQRTVLASIARADPQWKDALLPEPTGPEAFHAHLGPVVNHDALTYGVKALAGAPGERAPAWRAKVRDMLIANQVTRGVHAGSWEPIGVWDRVGGRIYSTAMAVRALAGP